MHKPGKRPRDVYLRLVGCFNRIREIADRSGLEILELEVDGTKKAAENAEPGDVYDIASLLVSELAFLHSQLKNGKPPREVFFAGRKFPSHVYQRAGILEKQLEKLEKLAAAEPGLLRSSAEKSADD